MASTPPMLSGWAWVKLIAPPVVIVVTIYLIAQCLQ